MVSLDFSMGAARKIVSLHFSMSEKMVSLHFSMSAEI